jgi:primosomal protein N' (replication factor Y)
VRETGLTGSAASAAQVVEVAIVDPSGALSTLSYAVPDHLSFAIDRGSAVTVPLGARRVTGIVLGPADTTKPLRLKAIAAHVHELDVPAELLDLAVWAARYYRAPLGTLLRTVVPPPVRKLSRRVVRPTGANAPSLSSAAAPSEPTLLQEENEGPASTLGQRVLARLPQNGLDLRQLIEELGDGVKSAVRTLQRRGLVTIDDVAVERRAPRRAVRAVAPDDGSTPNFPRAARQAEVWAFLRERAPHPLLIAELEERLPGATRTLAALAKRGLIEEAAGASTESAPDDSSSKRLPHDTVPSAWQRTPRPEQQAAIAAIRDAAGAFTPFLLFGVTGSGKTEVYLHAARDARDAGRGVLILVPEIGLTPQLIAEAARRFPGETTVLHSALSGPERWQAWRDVASGRARVVIGARSAVFAPLPDLGLIVVDEEHDAAYKQEESPRYHARDLAVMRAKLASCPVVLASATPSLESHHAAAQGRYQRLTLSARANDAPLPEVQIIDLRQQAPGSGVAGGPSRATRDATAAPPPPSPLSPVLESALVENYRAGDQSLLFLNRRGYARFSQCEACGHVENCPSCSVSLTLHRAQRIAACHHCGFTRKPSTHCPSCNALLAERGFGTEQIEDTVRALLPAARVARLDRDTATSAKHLKSTVDAWRHGDLDVLVGTQMVAKGHDAPGVTLIGVVLADASLHFPDFRAAERTFQLLAQVAGRAGRGHKPGRVLVQTRQPDHPSLIAAQQHDFERFARSELGLRADLGYPPFGRLTRVVVEGAAADVERRAASLAHRLIAVAEKIDEDRRPQILGPAPAPLERLRGRDRTQLLIKAPDAPTMAQILGVARLERASDGDATLRVVVDVDPVNML